MSPESPLHSLSMLDWGHLIAIYVHVPPEAHEPFVSNVRVAPGKERALTPRPQCQLCRILVSTLQVRTGDLGSLGISAGPHGQEQQNRGSSPGPRTSSPSVPHAMPPLAVSRRCSGTHTFSTWWGFTAQRE